MGGIELINAFRAKLLTSGEGQFMLSGNILLEFLEFLDEGTADGLRARLDLYPPPNESDAFGQWVASTRTFLNMGQSDLASASGVSQGDLSRLENNKKNGPPIGKERRDRIRKVLLDQLKTAANTARPKKT